MTQILPIFVSVLALLACSDANAPFNSNKPTRGDKSPEPSPQDDKTSDSDRSEDSDQTVSAPAPVGGSFLTCQAEKLSQGGLRSRCRLEGDGAHSTSLEARAEDATTGTDFKVTKAEAASSWHWVIEVPANYSEESGFDFIISHQSSTTFVFYLPYSRLSTEQVVKVEPKSPSDQNEDSTSDDSETEVLELPEGKRHLLLFTETFATPLRTHDQRCFYLTDESVGLLGGFFVDMAQNCPASVQRENTAIQIPSQNLCLDVRGSVFQVGTDVIFYECSNLDPDGNQQFNWTIYKTGFLLQTSTNSLCVGVDADDDNRLKLFDCL